MNFKHLFPTFRNRYKFVKAQVAKIGKQHKIEHALNLGTGEGDYDRMLAGFSVEMVGCDVNEEDIRYAAELNKDVANLRYETNNALALTYPTGHFDLVVSSEVIEHVGDPATMMREIARVLAPGGWAVLTFPSREFPFSYDPINRIWHWVRSKDSNERIIAQGAYAFGHEYLIGSADFKKWCADAGLEIRTFHPLSGWLVGLLEMYWTGIAQSIFKKNSRNVTSDTKGSLKVRPADTKEPALAAITDGILWLDEFWFGSLSSSVGKGVVLRKKEV
jgi:2-polyprenyl-3-methyl-5-hydroxy-6-metoxy-1,4-benzoquinol methylase